MTVVVEVTPGEPLEVTVTPVVVELSAPPPVEIEIIGGVGGGGGGGGASFITGVVPPTSATGFIGDYYLDTADQVLYGPKREESYLSVPDVIVVGYTQFTDTAGSVYTFTAPAGVQEGDLLVAFLNSQPASLGMSTIDGWYNVWIGLSSEMGANARWAQIVCRNYQASDPGPWTLAVNASHAGQRKIGTLVAVRNSITPTSVPLYNSPTDASVSMPVTAPEDALLIANWHGVFSTPNKGTLLTTNGTLVSSKGYPVTDGSVSSDWQHVISKKITGGSGTLTLTTAGPLFAAEKTTGAILAKYPAPTAEAPYASVDDMLTRKPFYWAHRGGSESSWGEHSQFTYDKAVAWGAPVLEISLNRTSDGVWFALHDQTINRTSPSAPANSDPYLMTWAQVNAYTQTYPGIANVPYLRLDTFLDRYKDSGVLIVVDPKYRSGTTLWKEMLDQVLAKFPADKVIAKGYYNGAAWAQYARGRGLKTWGYLYSADIPTLPTHASNWDILGLDIACTQAEWNTVKGFGKPVVGHIVSSMAEKDDALAKGADGLQTANVPATMPRKATPAETVTAWPVALSSVPPGGTAGQVLSKMAGTDYVADWATVSGGGGGGLDQATADGRYVNITGDTVTGPLIVPTPTQSTHATTKAYVDTADSTHDALATAHGNLRGTASPTYADASQWVVGTAAKFAREDHKHSVSTDVPVALGSSNAAGSSSALARADHVHVVPSLDNLSDVSTAGATSGQALVYSSGSWAPGTVSGGSGGNGTILQKVAPVSYWWWAGATGQGADWTRMRDAYPSQQFAICNPDSGVGASQNADWVTRIAEAQAAGLKVYGYVQTDYAGTSQSDAHPLATPASIKAEVDKYYTWYNVDGIFYDESSWEAAKVPFYLDIYNYVKNKTGVRGKTVIINPGSYGIDEGYMTTCDIIMTYENTAAEYLTTTFPAWMANYGPERFWHAIHTVTSTTVADQVLAKTITARAGYIYLSTSALSPNPWDGLPAEPYWSKQVNQAAASGPSGGSGLDQAAADARYVNLDGDTATGHIVITNADRLKYALTVERTATSTAVTDAEIFRVLYGGKRATWTNEKGNLRTSNEASKGEVAMKVIAASTAEGGTGNMLEVLDLAGNVQTRIGPLGRQNFNKGIRMVGDTIQIRDSTEVDESTISQALGADLVIAPKLNLSVNSKRITNLAAPVGVNDAATKQYVDTDNTTRLKKTGDTATGYIYLPASKAGSAQFRLPLGVAPTTPVDGDVWTTTAGLYVQISGATVGPLGAGGGGGLSQATADGLYVNVTGDSMTGPLTVTGGTNVNAAAATAASTTFQTAFSTRWAMGKNNVAESGANAGSDFSIGRYSDAGAWVADAININRKTGAVTVGTTLTASDLGANTVQAYMVPTAAADLTRKDYVDARTPKITVGTTAPSSPTTGDIWVDTN